MDLIKDISKEIEEGSYSIATKHVDKLLRERRLIPVDVLAEYRLSDDHGKEQLISQYGETPFKFTDMDGYFFILYLIKETHSNKNIVHLVNLDGETYECVVSLKKREKSSFIQDIGDGELKQVQENLLNRFKYWLLRKKQVKQ